MEQNKSLKDIILRPLMTEKVIAGEKMNKYTFLVKKDSNKIMLKQAIKEIYGVTPAKINLFAVKPKKVNRRGGTGIKGSKMKKAIVTLKSGQSLNKAK